MKTRYWEQAELNLFRRGESRRDGRQRESCALLKGTSEVLQEMSGTSPAASMNSHSTPLPDWVFLLLTGVLLGCHGSRDALLNGHDKLLCSCVYEGYNAIYNIS